MARRTFDVVAAGVLLLLASPIMLAATLVILVVSPGPAFHRATRIGLHGRPFDILKLRSMRVYPNGSGSVLTARNDPRLIPLGGWLRLFKIDELPQLFNVLKGDMSIVGPRPRDPFIVNGRYTLLHRETLRVRPGLTSPGSLFYMRYGEGMLDASKIDDLEQVYLRHILPVKLAIDLIYIREATVWSDVKTILMTFVMLFRLRRHGRRPVDLYGSYGFVHPVIGASAR